MPIATRTTDQQTVRDDAEAATRRLRRYLRFLGCERSALDDLVQETMLAAARTFAGEVPPLPWLLTTARNALRMYWRRRGRQREVTDLDRLHDSYVEQVGPDGGDAQRHALLECLAKVPARSRLVVELRYREGLSRREIATRVGIGEEGVKSLLARLHKALGECIRKRTEA